MTESHILRYENPWGEKFYFQSLGLEWPERPGFYPVSATTRDIEKARPFRCLADALEVWVRSNRVPGWIALRLEDGVVKQEIEL